MFLPLKMTHMFVLHVLSHGRKQAPINTIVLPKNALKLHTNTTQRTMYVHIVKWWGGGRRANGSLHIILTKRPNHDRENEHGPRHLYDKNLTRLRRAGKRKVNEKGLFSCKSKHFNLSHILAMERMKIIWTMTTKVFVATFKSCKVLYLNIHILNLEFELVLATRPLSSAAPCQSFFLPTHFLSFLPNSLCPFYSTPLKTLLTIQAPAEGERGV